MGKRNAEPDTVEKFRADLKEALIKYLGSDRISYAEFARIFELLKQRAEALSIKYATHAQAISAEVSISIRNEIGNGVS